jgi:hypothetical protein
MLFQKNALPNLNYLIFQKLWAVKIWYVRYEKRNFVVCAICYHELPPHFASICVVCAICYHELPPHFAAKVQGNFGMPLWRTRSKGRDFRRHETEVSHGSRRRCRLLLSHKEPPWFCHP